MRPVAWVVALGGALAFFASGCAKGSEFDGSVGGAGGSGSGQPSGTSSTGSKSTSTTTSSSTQSSMSTTAMSSSSTGFPCSEQPCKLTTPQCGCAPGDACTLDSTLMRACAPAGNAGPGQACSASNNCAPGGICLANPNIDSCLEFCESDADCAAPGGICFFTLNDGNGGTVPGVTLCTQNCDPATNTGCPVAGQGCQAASDTMSGKTFSYCGETGLGGFNAACTPGMPSCLADYGCFNNGTSNICLQWCKVAAPSCSNGLTCLSLQTPLIIGTTEYGVCD